MSRSAEILTVTRGEQTKINRHLDFDLTLASCACAHFLQSSSARLESDKFGEQEGTSGSGATPGHRVARVARTLLPCGMLHAVHWHRGGRG